MSISIRSLFAVATTTLSLVACDGTSNDDHDAGTRYDLGVTGRDAQSDDVFSPGWSCGDAPCEIAAIDLTSSASQPGSTFVTLDDDRTIGIGGDVGLFVSFVSQHVEWDVEYDIASPERFEPYAYPSFDELVDASSDAVRAFGPYGEYCAAIGNGAVRCVATLYAPESNGFRIETPILDSPVRQIRFSTDASWIVVRTEDGAVRFFDLNPSDDAPVACETLTGSAFCGDEPLFTNALSVVVGASQICAMLADGTVGCMNSSHFSRSGLGGPETWTGPTAVPGLSDVVAISTGADASGTCALTGDGRVLCWGSFASYTEDCDLADAPWGCWAEPHEIRFPGAVDAIRSGRESVCGLVGDALHCAGTNRAGQVGDGTFTQRENAVHVLDDVRLFEIGRLHACAATTDSRLYCWGDNEIGQIGDAFGASTHLCTSLGGSQYACVATPTRVLGC